MKDYKIQLTSECINEIQQTVNYYNIQSKGLGKKFWLAIQKQILKIKQNPFARSVRYNDVRFAIIESFPYAAHYTINETKRVIIIHAVLSFHQNPITNWIK